jgi:hypothetical protein
MINKTLCRQILSSAFVKQHPEYKSWESRRAIAREVAQYLVMFVLVCAGFLGYCFYQLVNSIQNNPSQADSVNKALVCIFGLSMAIVLSIWQILKCRSRAEINYQLVLDGAEEVAKVIGTTVEEILNVKDGVLIDEVRHYLARKAYTFLVYELDTDNRLMAMCACKDALPEVTEDINLALELLKAKKKSEEFAWAYEILRDNGWADASDRIYFLEAKDWIAQEAFANGNDDGEGEDIEHFVSSAAGADSYPEATE